MGNIFSSLDAMGFYSTDVEWWLNSFIYFVMQFIVFSASLQNCNNLLAIMTETFKLEILFFIIYIKFIHYDAVWFYVFYIYSSSLKSMFESTKKFVIINFVAKNFFVVK